MSLICLYVQEIAMTRFVLYLKMCVYLLTTAVMNTNQCSDLSSLGATCPCHCSCCLYDSDIFGSSSLGLTINCVNDSCGGQLSQKLDEMLINLSRPSSKAHPVVQLWFSTNLLKYIPERICQLYLLNKLILHIVNLKQLNSSCFRNMSKLVTFVVGSSDLTLLPDDLFEGLTELQEIMFSDNKITDLQPELFWPLAKASKLKTISFKKNRLQSVDVWPLYLIDAIRISATDDLLINLDSNNISRFTNRLNYSSRCIENDIRVFDVSFKDNQITHISDIVNGWNIPGGNISCLLNSHVKFNLAKNPLICDCVDYGHYMQMKASEQMSGTTDTMHCSSPSSMAGERLVCKFDNMDSFICNISNNCPERCNCEQHPNKTVIIVSCDGLYFTQLPYLLPKLPKGAFFPYTYVLQLASNKIKIWGNFSYLNQTSSLLLSNNSLTYVDLEIWKQLHHASTIDLNHNKLTALLPALAQLELASLKEIHLYDNPWSCDCHALWMKRWLDKLGTAVAHRDSIQCYYNDIRKGISMYQLRDDYFVCHRILSVKEYLIIIIPSIVGACFLSASVVIFFIYAKFKRREIGIDECNGEEMDYDAFFSYANEDEHEAITLANMLNRERYNVCTHHRYLDNNLARTIKRSKRTVCYLTQTYLEDRRCMKEFEFVFSLDNQHNRHSLIVIKHPDLNVRSITIPSVKTYFANYTCIEHPSPNTQNTLLNRLPQLGIRQITELDIYEVVESSERIPIFTNMHRQNSF